MPNKKRTGTHWLALVMTTSDVYGLLNDMGLSRFPHVLEVVAELIAILTRPASERTDKISLITSADKRCITTEMLEDSKEIQAIFDNFRHSQNEMLKYVDSAKGKKESYLEIVSKGLSNNAKKIISGEEISANEIHFGNFLYDIDQADFHALYALVSLDNAYTAFMSKDFDTALLEYGNAFSVMPQLYGLKEHPKHKLEESAYLGNISRLIDSSKGGDTREKQGKTRRTVIKKIATEIIEKFPISNRKNIGCTAAETKEEVRRKIWPTEQEKTLLNEFDKARLKEFEGIKEEFGDRIYASILSELAKENPSLFNLTYRKNGKNTKQKAFKK